MTQHTTLVLLASAGLVFAYPACTKLDDPNDRFGSTSSFGGGQATGGASGDFDAAATGGTATGGIATGGSSETAPDSGASCEDSGGLSGFGCYRCTPFDILTLESACTKSTCLPFDNAQRLTHLQPNGSLPTPPSSPAGGAPSAGTTPSSATGGSAGAGGASGDPTGGAATTGGVSSAYGQCDALTARGKAIYVTGSSAAKPFLQQIAQQLATGGVYIVYTSTGSCVGVDAILNNTPMTTGASPALATTATYWDSTSSSGTACMLPSSGITADLGISDVFAQTCPGFELSSLEASQAREAHGPIQTMTFAVPANSKARSISAQAAYFVFGFGADGGVLDTDGLTPVWNDELSLFQRSATSGTQAMIAAAIGLAPGVWKGKSHKSSDEVATDLQAASASQETADKALGILAADYIDSKNLRAQIRVLAYQDSNQPCAFYPDSSESSHDKRNVRDGHYPIWSPLHVLYKVDSSGSPLNTSARTQILEIIGYLSGTKVLPNGIKLMDVYAQNGLIPECAMRVSRQKDGGNILPYAPTSPCSCLFEFKATGSTTCTPCSVQGDCGANETCSLGYCEK